MPFVEAARAFLEDPGELAGDKNINMMDDTIGFILNNAIGLENAKSTDKIVDFLKEKGHEINRYQWQIAVLGKLREEGIFIAANKSKGMFIVKNKDEAENFYSQYAKRIEKENDRLAFLRALIDNSNWEN